MFKILTILVLLYFSYRLFIPKAIDSGSEKGLESEDEEFTDYEEID